MESVPLSPLDLRSDPPPFGIQELIPVCTERRSKPLNGRRINLVIPAISRSMASFGGIATALRFLHRMLLHFEYARIVVTYEKESDVDLLDWQGWNVESEALASRTILFLGGKSTLLSIAATDFFIATFWTTALYVRQLIARQIQWFPDACYRFVYLIQEYEPAFYPGSARKVYAESTYRDHGDVIAIINSTPVARHLKRKGIYFNESYAFDPMIHPMLQQMKEQLRGETKSRLLLAYARPGIPQNDFDLVVESLKAWTRIYPTVDEWSLHSAGLPHPDVSLGGRSMLRSLGTLDLGEYARLLSRSWVGLSFTFNASTSYSAREMAEFGAWVVTNQFEHRESAALPPNVIVAAEPTPLRIAQRLSWCCDRFRSGMTSTVPDIPPVFKTGSDEFPFMDALMKSWSQ